MTKVPGLETQKAFDADGRGADHRHGAGVRPRQPVVVMNARTRARQLIWAEIDSNAAAKEDVTLLIRPGVNFDEGERYIVALRNLKGEDGKTLEAPEGFRIYRDRVLDHEPDVEGAARRTSSRMFGTLAEAGIDRDTLYRAWDFTVASERNLSERVLAIRDDAFAQLGDTNLADMKVRGRAPDVRDRERSRRQPRGPARAAVGGHGTPCRATSTSRTALGRRRSATRGLDQRPAGDPRAAPTQPRFQCNIPKSATGAAAPSRPSLYGHGLLGSRGEVNQGSCATSGSSTTSSSARRTGSACRDRHDLPTVARDPEGHVELPAARRPRAAGDVNFLYLGRLMIHPDGFSATRTSR